MAGSNTGHRFLKELAQLGCRVVLLTLDEHRDAGWPLDCIEELHVMPGGMTLDQITNTVTYLARSRKFAGIVALDRTNLEVAAGLREHLRIPGMGVTTTRYFSDRLSARIKASHLGVRVPAFTAVANYDALRAYMQDVPAPWLLTPRSDASCCATRELHDSERVWRTLEALGDRQSHFFLEQFVAGDRFHVDSITANGTVVFAAVSPYVGAVADAAQAGELLPTLPAPYGIADDERLRRVNTALLSSLRLVRGVTHSEFLRSHATGEFYFVETSASVEDGCIADMMRETHGLNLWAEWARLEVAAMRGERYALPSAGPVRKIFGKSGEGQHRLA
ncbi:MAG: ATP-grasp domain-containing protein [Acidobacteriaceae bacterium]